MGDLMSFPKERPRPMHRHPHSPFTQKSSARNCCKHKNLSNALDRFAGARRGKTWCVWHSLACSLELAVPFAGILSEARQALLFFTPHWHWSQCNLQLVTQHCKRHCPTQYSTKKTFLKPATAIYNVFQGRNRQSSLYLEISRLLHVMHQGTCNGRSKGTTGSKCPEACQGAHWCHPHKHPLSSVLTIIRLECAAALDVLKEHPPDCTSLSPSPWGCVEPWTQIAGCPFAAAVGRCLLWLCLEQAWCTHPLLSPLPGGETRS